MRFKPRSVSNYVTTKPVLSKQRDLFIPGQTDYDAHIMKGSKSSLNLTKSKFSNDALKAFNADPSQVFVKQLLPSEDCYREAVTTSFNSVSAKQIQTTNNR